MSKANTSGRHGPAFVLMQVAKNPGYGLDILNRLNEEMPVPMLDSAAIYRSLQQLEDAGAVTSEWDTADKGPAKKRYSITENGRALLAEYLRDIEMRKQNIEYLIRSIKTCLETPNV